MSSQEQQIERVEALRELMDRLCNPDLTLIEAKSLRHRLAVLLDQDDSRAGQRTDSGTRPLSATLNEGIGRRKPLQRPGRSLCGAC